MTQYTAKSTREQNENIGTTFRASGNLFIAVRTTKGLPKIFGGGFRGCVKSFSPDSARRMRRYLRECLPEYRQMVTLTYPHAYPCNGEIAKQHLKRFLQELKREHQRHCFINGSDYKQHSSFWFLEFQERGAPHFHIFTTWAPVAKETNNWVAKTWYNIVESDDIRHLQAGTRTEFLRSGRAGTISYASKYAAKQTQKIVPSGYENVGRFWGVTGRRSVMSAATWVSAAQAQNTDIITTKNAIKAYISKQIDIGNMEILKRDDGVLIITLLNPVVMRTMRAYVSLLSCKTMVVEQFFCDAHLEE